MGLVNEKNPAEAGPKTLAGGLNPESTLRPPLSDSVPGPIVSLHYLGKVDG